METEFKCKKPFTADDKKKFYIVEEGCADLFVCAKDLDTLYRRHHLRTFEQGEIIFGANFLKNDKTYVFIISGSQDCTLKELSYDKLSSNPMFALYVLEEIKEWGKMFGLPPSPPADEAEIKEIEKVQEDIQSGIAKHLDEKADAEEKYAKYREENNARMMADSNLSFLNLIKKGLKDGYKVTEGNLIYEAAKKICKLQGIGIVSYDEFAKTQEEDITIKAIASKSQFEIRSVTLNNQWYRQDNGHILCYVKKDMHPAVLMQDKPGKYILVDIKENSKTVVNETVAEGIEKNAYVLYRPLPKGKIGPKGLVNYAMGCCRARDIISIILPALAASLAGLAVPLAAKALFDDFIPSGDIYQILQAGVLLIAFMAGKYMFDLSKGFAVMRMSGKIESAIQPALWQRLLSLPIDFFSEYTSGELTMRSLGIASIMSILSNVVINAIVTGAFSLLYLIQMFAYGGILGWYGLICLCIVILAGVCMTLAEVKHMRSHVDLSNKLSGTVLQLIKGVSKFRTAGAEKRAFNLWAKDFRKTKEAEEKTKKSSNLVQSMTSSVPILFSVIFFAVMIKKNLLISIGGFIAFNTAFLMLSEAVMKMIDIGASAGRAVTLYEKIKPILQTLPEYSEEKISPGELSGQIEVSHVSYRYSDDMPLILKDVSFTVKEGEYVALIGSSGSGKSTLLKILLGFCRPISGQVYYDQKDISLLNLRDVRRQIGVVMQNGKLVGGDIYSNIVGSNPKLSLEDAEEAAIKAGMYDDIKNMPMGMHTIVSEDGGTLSGGQRQRIMIARAIAAKPKIIYFDEATSALDNKTQGIISKSLDEMNATRITIAHRLSTVINCDRIIVLDDGRIAEQGSYEELMKLNGIFAKMAVRQLV